MAADDLSLRSAVARSHSGADLGTALGGEAIGVPVYDDVARALESIRTSTS